MGSIKDLPLVERPREKALKYGISILSDSELLAVLIQSGTKQKSAISIAIDLIINFNGIANVFKQSLYELCKIEGINKIKALQILAISELFIRIRQNMLSNQNEQINLANPYEVYDYIHLKISSLLQKKMIVLYLNIKNIVIFEEMISLGNDSMSVTNNKLICKRAIEKYAKKVIICHNHPSGVSAPSLEDVASTMSLKSALMYIQVTLLDHIIIGKDEFYSIINDKRYFLKTK